MSSVNNPGNPAVANPLEKAVNSVEVGLSYTAVVPGVGLIKVALGTLQAVAAVAVLIFAGLPQLLFAGKNFFLLHSLTHIGHGLGNILAGTIEALPLVGIGLLIYRLVREGQERVSSSADAVIADPEAFKFMPYESVQKANFYPHSSLEGFNREQEAEYYTNLRAELGSSAPKVWTTQGYKYKCNTALSRCLLTSKDNTVEVARAARPSDDGEPDWGPTSTSAFGQ